MFIFLATIEDKEDRTKIEQIYELYATSMKIIATSILRSEEDAEDAVQTAMLNACKHVKKLQDPKDKNTKWYVMQVTRNAAREIYRKKKKQWKQEMSLEEDLVGEDSLVPYDGESEIAKRIEGLAPRDRDIIMLKYLHGYEYSEIGQILGISTEAAKKAGQRAKQRLEKAMGKEDQSID
ncbi:MAG: sigma-70 family RNA polymerase sigma factor [Lachnospiraceae bacterium]|nr:sigma-70 family RNA polymerase sigma factor [Lachnospiraceae bacterium]